MKKYVWALLVLLILSLVGCAEPAQQVAGSPEDITVSLPPELPTATLSPSPTPTTEPTPQPEPFVVQPAKGGHLAICALIGDRWVYQEEDGQLCSISLDAPEGEEPIALSIEGCWQQFLIWNGKVVYFEKPSQDIPYRAHVADPLTGEIVVIDKPQSEFFVPFYAWGEECFDEQFNERSPNRLRVHGPDFASKVLYGMPEQSWAIGMIDGWTVRLNVGLEQVVLFQEGEERVLLTAPGGISHALVVGDVVLVSAPEEGTIAVFPDGTARILSQEAWSMNPLLPDAVGANTPATVMRERYLEYPEYLITPKGVYPIDGMERDDSPRSHDGGAVIYPDLRESDRIPWEEYPVYSR